MMKRLFFVAVLVLAVVMTVSAQGFTEFGGKVGLNFATIGGDNTSGAKTATMFALGGFATYKIIDELSLQGEVFYDNKGFKDDFDTYTLGFLDINVLAKYPLPIESDIKASVYAGPTLGFNVSKTNVVGDVGSDYGLIFGAGAGYPVGDGSITLDVRYNLGLSQTIRTYTNQVFSILVGYSLPIK
jgi:hypothetical protein